VQEHDDIECMKEMRLRDPERERVGLVLSWQDDVRPHHRHDLVKRLAEDAPWVLFDAAVLAGVVAVEQLEQDAAARGACCG
jgi:hypothetical protein